MGNDDPFDLSRFVQAQEPVLGAVLAELRTGQKRTHWMWFIFPQLRALGRSPIAQFYGISSFDEARTYLDHPVLVDNLVRTTEAVLAHRGRTAHAIFGSPDDLKFRSSMTLFRAAAGRDGTAFDAALKHFFDGEPDERTLVFLRLPPGA